MRKARAIPFIAAILTVFTTITACSSDNSTTNELTLIAYNSFTPPEGAFDEFTQETGITVQNSTCR